MQQEERDRTLLAILEPEDRHKIEEIVDDVIADGLPTVDEAHLEAAAAAFDFRAESCPTRRRLWPGRSPPRCAYAPAGLWASTEQGSPGGRAGVGGIVAV